MGKISKETIRQLLDSTDIVEVVSSYLSLKRAGASWKGVCPFHNDSHPSLTVTPAKQRFMCFACNTGGDAIEFVRKIENIKFTEAVHKLADRAGIVIEEGPEDPQEKLRRTLIQVNKDAGGYFQHLLLTSPSAEHARQYLQERGLSEEVVKRWGIGWAPKSSREFLTWANRYGKISLPYLEKAGLAATSEEGQPYARFRDRLMFPIRNSGGECVAFSGRVLGTAVNTGKYVNSPETLIFKKGQIVFGLDRARNSISREGRVLICEGQIDVISIHEAGLTYAVAPLGTAFTHDHARLLRRYTSRALLCFDSDRAGMSAADKAFAILAPLGMEVMLVTLPQGDDPDSLIRREGATVFARTVNEARPFFEVRIEREKREGNLNSPVEISEFINQMIELIVLVPNPVLRDLYITDLATRLHVSLPNLRGQVEYLQRQRKGKKPVQQEAEQHPDQPEAVATPIFVHRSIVELCELALRYPDAQAMLLDRYEDLYEPMETVPGGIALRYILDEHPGAGDLAAIQAFIYTLPPEVAKALEAMDFTPLPVNDLTLAVDQACSGVARTWLEMKQGALLEKLKSGNLSSQQIQSVMKELEEIRKLLSTPSSKS